MASAFFLIVGFSFKKCLAVLSWARIWNSCFCDPRLQLAFSASVGLELEFLCFSPTFKERGSAEAGNLLQAQPAGKNKGGLTKQKIQIVRRRPPAAPPGEGKKGDIRSEL
jgi:hypothetical protein